MLKSINLRNYKAFDDVTIPICPLTILLGANSVGKSSIIQMLMLLHQTAEEKGSSYSSALKIYGRYVNGGSFENLFKRRNTKVPIGLRLAFSSETLSRSLSEKRSRYISDFQDLCRYFPLKKLWDMSALKISNKKEFYDFVVGFFDLLDKKGAEAYKPHLEHFLKKRLGISKAEQKRLTHPDIMKAYNLLDYLEKKRTSDSFAIDYEIALNKEKTQLYVNKISFLLDDDTVLLSISCNEESGYDVKSNVVDLTVSDKNFVGNFFNPNTTIFDCIMEGGKTDNNDTSSFGHFIHVVLLEILRQSSECLSEYMINYVSPLRAHPKRYYMLDKAKITISLDTLDGDAIAEVLKENGKVKTDVNGWLSKFGFKVSVREFKEVIHHLNVTQNDMNLDITDVGFGISQVLPIIIQGFLSMEKSVTIVEQPEIHLHPRMQADLGDLFIDMITSTKKKMIIETHSEYLLKRIRRRISEKKISNKDVAICLFHPRIDNKDAWVETLDVDDKGMFVWPENFYDGELLKDITEFLKNQN